MGGQSLDELGPFPFECRNVGVDIGRNLIDGDEQRELTGPQRVENLTVVMTGPDIATVGDEAQAREVVTSVANRSEGDAHPSGGKPGVEQRPNDTQRDEVAEGVPRRTLDRDEARAGPVA